MASPGLSAVRSPGFPGASGMMSGMEGDSLATAQGGGAADVVIADTDAVDVELVVSTRLQLEARLRAILEAAAAHEVAWREREAEVADGEARVAEATAEVEAQVEASEQRREELEQAWDDLREAQRMWREERAVLAADAAAAAVAVTQEAEEGAEAALSQVRVRTDELEARMDAVKRAEEEVERKKLAVRSPMSTHRRGRQCHMPWRGHTNAASRTSPHIHPATAFARWRHSCGRSPCTGGCA